MRSALAFLVVEDEAGVRRALVRALAAHGEVESAGTCAAARLAIRARAFDAVLIDVTLPDGDGLDLIKLATKHSPGVCVLVLTGSTDHAVIGRILQEGARYLLKPCHANHLAVLAADALARRNARERRTKVILQRWEKDYSLSETEVELLTLGTDGVAREEFSRLRGVRPDTIRKQIQALLQKTGDDTFEGAVTSLLREAVAEPT
jgi:DNA-binding NarL/FixJ family response regulator